MERRKDIYYRKAKKQGYSSRAAYKLIEIDRKFPILFSGMRVLEIGSSPGGWTDVIMERNPEFLVCVDLTAPKTQSIPLNIRGDITREETWETIRNASKNGFDLFLSDAMAHTTGQHDRDHAMSVEICRSVMDHCDNLLLEDGTVLLKQFQGDMTKEFIDTYRGRFKKVYITKPSSSRSESSEIYIIFSRFRGNVQ
ncbi:SAM-dependent methyltransferase [Cuniculiplasma sp. SKW3]|uniref:SAM-dependent methyltransferase n=1 Tax=Cuniculiplasma sp. SKW3 TaxID=3400170 RepID=UPI003FD618A3